MSSAACCSGSRLAVLRRFPSVEARDLKRERGAVAN